MKNDIFGENQGNLNSDWALDNIRFLNDIMVMLKNPLLCTRDDAY